MRLQYLYALTLALSVAACTSLGLMAPQSLDESIAYSQSQVSALEQSAASALTTKTITVSEAQQALSMGDQATAAINAARAAESVGDTSTAQGKLALATSILTQLSAYLAVHGVK